MAAYAVYRHIERRDRCHHRALLYADTTIGNILENSANVEADKPVHLWIRQTTLLHHGLCAAGSLFCGLEDQYYLTGEGIRMGRQDLRCAQQHGHMRIVTAGVHCPVCGCKGEPCLFPDGQCIHIRPESDGLAGAISLDHCGYAAVGVSAIGNAHFGQPLANEILCLRKVAA